MVIGFYKGLREDEILLTSMKLILNVWADTWMKKYCPHIMVTLKGRFKG